MAQLYSYTVRYDTGFAPNPFHGYCTLATCKHRIRGTAQVGDWIIGTGSKSKGRGGCLVYAMRVTKTMSFDEYWKDPRFQIKKPAETGERERACGDNIYYIDPNTNRLCQTQRSCHDHCHMDNDTKADRVLISDDFIYWGGDGPLLHKFCGTNLLCVRNHKCNFPDAVVREFEKWIQDIDDKGLVGNPTDWQDKGKKHCPVTKSTRKGPGPV